MGNKHRLQILYEMGLQRALLEAAQRHGCLQCSCPGVSSASSKNNDSPPWMHSDRIMSAMLTHCMGFSSQTVLVSKRRRERERQRSSLVSGAGPTAQGGSQLKRQAWLMAVGEHNLLVFHLRGPVRVSS